MTKTRFRFKNSTIKNRIRKNKPVWLWKWTSDARYKYRDKIKYSCRKWKIT